MIVLNVAQGTTEWANARLGIPTASQMNKIITPAKLELSKSADDYAHQLIAEQLLGVPLDNATSGFMQRGSILEARAISYYELQRECDTEAIGFILRDDRRSGCSPDRFVGKDGMLEIKIPSAANHVGYLLDEKGIGYRIQVQSQLWIAEREWNDTLSWNPELPPALVRQYRDEETIKKIAAAVDQFCNYVDELKLKLQKQYGLFQGFQTTPLRVVA